MNFDRWKGMSSQPRQLIIWGGSDQCRVNYPILKQLGYEILAIVDDTPEKESPIPEIPILLGEVGLNLFLKGHSNNRLGFVAAIGNPYGHIRLKLDQSLRDRGLAPISFSDPTALICSSSLCDDGLQMMPAAILHNDVRVGRQCIINTRALVEHDCVLEDGVEIGPGAVLCGRVHVGKNTWIGANATVNPRLEIGSNSIVGAGSVVVSNVPSNVVVVGVPAKVIRENQINE